MNILNSNESQIRKIIEGRIKAIEEKDIETILSSQSKDIIEFDLLSPLQYTGIDTVKERIQEWFSSYPGTIGYEIKDLNVAVSDDVAYCHFLYHVSGTLKAGDQVNMWVRATMCFQKIHDNWLITHEHSSVPLNMETGKGEFDLKP